MAVAQGVRSPASASFSSAYSRIVSSIVNRTSPWRSSPIRTRLCSARRSRPPRTSSDAVVAGDPAHRLGRLERPAAGEHAEAREQPLLLRVEQVVAPVDRAAQRPLALRQVARARRQQRQPVAEARDIAAGERIRIRAAASSIASGRPSSRRTISATWRPFSAVSAKSGPDRHGALDEQPHRLRGHERVRGR